MSKKELDVAEQAQVMLVQKYLTDNSELKVGELHNKLNSLSISQQEVSDKIDVAFKKFRNILENNNTHLLSESSELQELMADNCVIIDGEVYILDSSDEVSTEELVQVEFLETIDINKEDPWEDVYATYQDFANNNNIDLTDDPFRSLMSKSQRIEFEKLVKQDFTYQTAQCDKYDYMIAVTCGFISSIVDICFVSFKINDAGKVTDTGLLTKKSDEFTDIAVKKFAKLCGWKGSKDSNDTIEKAIGFLERKFRINYDHTSHESVSKMWTKNHHIKSLGHSPDLIGLFFSILGQFTNTAHFISGGKLITIDSEFQLQGNNFVAKVFSGFANWLGHLFSDMAGSSGGRGSDNGGRGSGIPIPFYSLLQFLDIGKFNVNKNDKNSFADACVMAFQEGYDSRHGMAMAVPVLICELLTRLMYFVKQKFYHKHDWIKFLPDSKPEVTRMLLVSHGTLSLIDAGHAGIKSGGNMVAFLLQSNIVAYVRFGTLALKEIKNWYYIGKVNPKKIELYLDSEYKRMLSK